jgi:hypothetical protein
METELYPVCCEHPDTMNSVSRLGKVYHQVSQGRSQNRSPLRVVVTRSNTSTSGLCLKALHPELALDIFLVRALEGPPHC